MTLKRKYSWKFTLASFLLTIGLMIPSTYVHELGHGAICKMEGYDFEFAVGLSGGVLDCPGIPEPHLLFYFIGGGTAALVFVAVGLIGSFTYRPLAVTGMTIGASNFMVAMLETFAHGWYMTANPFVVLGINVIAMLIWFGFVTYYHPKKEIGNTTSSGASQTGAVG